MARPLALKPHPVWPVALGSTYAVYIRRGSLFSGKSIMGRAEGLRHAILTSPRYLVHGDRGRPANALVR